MNKIIISQKQCGYHPKNDTYFNILNPANYLHCFQFTTPKGS